MRHDLSAIGEVDELLIKEAKETEERYQFLSKEFKEKHKIINTHNEYKDYGIII